jgi:hypothetical protein
VTPIHPAKDAQIIAVWAFLFSEGTFRLSRCHIYLALLSTILSTPDSREYPLNAVIKAVNTVQWDVDSIRAIAITIPFSAYVVNAEIPRNISGNIF